MVEVHAYYEPDPTDPVYGDCHSVVVDLFKRGQTFRIYFKIVDGEINVEYVERVRF